MKSLKFILITLIVVAIAVFAGSPYYTAYQLKQAYDAHDGTALASHINFDQLQPNIENQLTSKFSNTLQQYPLVAQLGGDALNQAANEFISSAVSNAVTADNVTRLIDTQGQANQATKELAAAWAIASNKVNLRELVQDIIVQRGDIQAVIQNQMQQVIKQQSGELQQHVESGEDSSKPKLSYCGINCFTISGQVKGYPLTLEMTREGLIGWKVVNVVLP
ncbi:DUF2939 domain-containing protein [Psychrobacter sanguinis]|uniref:DUF2939 domain-containing protein n=1 Tax=Psychrobacter sanguinis TaxID=861445 RepID=UPI00020C7A6F|nr:DUF2939 domain-containing protein [Psychrobacter sanguinis]EGK13174.1 hypothetical protein HMPREF9373_1339 [Psychrobacter sp. 1501(2011)]MCD9150273.1 DUF2939 domain-containing protein [Psychrobacter sanguinis]